MRFCVEIVFYRKKLPKYEELSMKRHLAAVFIAALLVSILCAQSKEATVYVTAQGKKYHMQHCRTIAKSAAVPVDKASAEQQGYSECKVCAP